MIVKLVLVHTILLEEVPVKVHALFVPIVVETALIVFANNTSTFNLDNRFELVKLTNEFNFELIKLELEAISSKD